MTKREFVRIMESSIRKIEKGEREFTCILLEPYPKLLEDYKNTFGNIDNGRGGYYIGVCFDRFDSKGDHIGDVKEVRLNALTMYMVQALEFETYKDL